MEIKPIGIMLGGALLAAACVSGGQMTTTPGEPTAMIEATPDLASFCPPTTAPTVMDCPTQQPTQEQKSSLRQTTISSSNLTLRAGPSIAHPALGSFPLGTDITILGKAPGGSWAVVSAPAGHLGWMYTVYLDIPLTDPLADVAVVNPTDSWVIAGQVLDDAGKPVEHIGVSVALGGLTDYPDYTDGQGAFVLFAPTSQPGPWTVSVKGVGCLSRLVNEDCELIGHVLRNPNQVYRQGQSGALTFVYEATSMRLVGRVVDASGNPYVGAGVFATRSDGAYVTGNADLDGQFDIPITAGTWRLMATRGVSMSIVVPESGFSGELVLVGSRN